MRNLLMLLALGFGTLTAFAEGTVSVEDVRHLLSEQPAVQAMVDSTLDLRYGRANRLGHVWGDLAGARVGPYRFEASLKGKQRYVLTLVLCTAVTYKDAGGNTSTEIGDTPGKPVGFTEKLQTIMLYEGPISPYRSCPE